MTGQDWPGHVLTRPSVRLATVFPGSGFARSRAGGGRDKVWPGRDLARPRAGLALALPGAGLAMASRDHGLTWS
jgi:hypothetical protein